MTQASDFKKWDCVRLEWSDPAGLPVSWEPVTKKSMDVAGCITVGQVYKVWLRPCDRHLQLGQRLNRS